MTLSDIQDDIDELHKELTNNPGIKPNTIIQITKILTSLTNELTSTNNRIKELES